MIIKTRYSYRAWSEQALRIASPPPNNLFLKNTKMSVNRTVMLTAKVIAFF